MPILGIKGLTTAWLNGDWYLGHPVSFHSNKLVQISLWGHVGVSGSLHVRLQASVVQKLDNAIHQINHYPVVKC